MMILPDFVFFEPTPPARWPRRASCFELPDGGELVRVPLTRGCWAVVEPDDWRRISGRYGRVWHANVDARTGAPYAYTRVPGAARKTSGRMIALHRAVAGAGPGETVRFRNGNPLDCRRGNLELG